MSESDKLEAKSWREAIYYANRLEKEINIDAKEIIKSTETSHALNKKLNEEIQSFVDRINIEGLLKKLKNDFNNFQQLSDDDFFWLNKNDRAIGFCVIFLKMHHSLNPIKENNEEPGRFNNNAFEGQRRLLHSEKKLTRTTPLTVEHFLRNPGKYLRVSLPKNANLNSQNNRIDFIKNSFKNSNINLKGQKYIIWFLSELWGECYQSKNNYDFIKWLKRDDEEKVNFCLNYQLSYDKDNQLPWLPINMNEKYLALVAIFDYKSLINSDEFDLLIKKIKSAWNQKTYRDRSKEKKSGTLLIKEETKERLSHIAKEKGYSNQKMIKYLIDEQYEKINKFHSL